MRPVSATILAVPVLLAVVLSDAPAQMPRTLNYQGTLVSGSSIVPDGNYNVTFRLYEASSGGSAVWSEAQVVATHNGVFNAILGKSFPLPATFNTSYWLSLQIWAEPELSPRLEMTGVCYSMQSAVSDSARKVPNGSIGTSQLASNSVTAAKLSASGSVSGQVPISNGSTVTWGRAGLVNCTVVHPAALSLASVTTTPTKIADLTTFTKTSSSSIIEVLFDGRLSVASMTSSHKVVFRIRIDDLNPATGMAEATVAEGEVGHDGVSSHITGIFTGLSAGIHTVSIWAYRSSGTATEAYVNPGNYGAQLVIKEID